MAVAGLGFRGRLLAAMLSLVGATALALGLVFMIYLLEDEKQRAEDSLEVANRVIREVIAGRRDLLTGNLHVLVDDFGFRSAVASDDRATLESALANHADRAGADIGVVLDSGGATLATVGIADAALQQFLPQLLSAARGQGSAERIIQTGERALQMFMVPVQGAGLRAWLVAGYVLDDRFARQLAELTGTDVVFRGGRASRSAGQLLATSLSGRQARQLPESLTAANDSALVESREFFARILDMGDQRPAPVQAVLMINREQALANYYHRAADLALILLLAIVLSGLVVLFTARALGRPVLDLARFATAIGDGLDTAEPPRPRTRELQTLQGALTTMQQRVREREARIRFNAFHDELTGLANRKALNETLAALLAEGKRAMLTGVTLTRFRALNDTLGFGFGDRVLALAADRLRSAIGGRAIVLARSGGNEFVALTGADDDNPETLLAVLRDALQAPASISETPISLHVAVAGLRLPRDASTLDEVRRRLSLTLRRAEKTPEQIATYQPGGDESHLRELTLVQDLRRAIDNDALTVVYQPKIDMAGATPVQVEALARWHHPEMGFISPEEFILLAEQSGQIRHLTRLILNRIAADLADWDRQGLSMGAAINLSALDLSNPRLVSDIHRAFDSQGGDFRRLTFEVTESAFMSDADAAQATLDSLRDLGATLSVDDFGTGYSSLSQLRQLPVQELKIDKSFVLKLDREHQDQLIVRSTIDMAHGLGLTVVAEGIENLASWRLLQQWGCDKAQGFYLARPMPPTALLQWTGNFRDRMEELQPAITGDLK